MNDCNEIGENEDHAINFIDLTIVLYTYTFNIFQII